MTIVLGDSGNNVFKFYPYEMLDITEIRGGRGFDTVNILTYNGVQRYFGYDSTLFSSVERLTFGGDGTAGITTMYISFASITAAGMQELVVLPNTNLELSILVTGSGSFAVPDLDVDYGSSAVYVELAFGEGQSGTLSYNPGLPFNQGLVGNAGNDTLLGGSGAQSLTGGAGADYMEGGDGDDDYSVDQSGDVVVEQQGGGHDTVYSSINYTLGQNFEDLTLTNNASVGRGNGSDNRITGAYQSQNYLVGEAGRDILVGGGQADRLIGGPGKDRLYGQSGDDALYGGAGNDRLFGQSGNDTLFGGQGRDWLDCGAGIDEMTGGEGADLFILQFLPKTVVANGPTKRITDFSSVDGDLIDLRQVDADDATADEQAFTFIRGRGFSGTAGELRLALRSDHALLLGDFDGDGLADFSIRLDGVTSLSPADFLL